MGLTNWAKRDRRSPLATLMTPALVTALWLVSATPSVADWLWYDLSSDKYYKPSERKHVPMVPLENPGKFQLFNNCKGVRLVVESGNYFTQKNRELTDKVIEPVVRSRLQGAGMYRPLTNMDLDVALLIVKVRTISSTSRAVSLAFKKWVEDVRFDGGSGVVTTHKVAAFGRAGESGYVLTTLSRLVDGFIEDYLHANADACK